MSKQITKQALQKQKIKPGYAVETINSTNYREETTARMLDKSIPMIKFESEGNLKLNTKNRKLLPVKVNRNLPEYQRNQTEFEGNQDQNRSKSKTPSNRDFSSQILMLPKPKSLSSFDFISDTVSQEKYSNHFPQTPKQKILKKKDSQEKYIQKMGSKKLKNEDLQDKGLFHLMNQRKKYDDLNEKTFLEQKDRLKFGVTPEYLEGYSKDEIVRFLMQPNQNVFKKQMPSGTFEDISETSEETDSVNSEEETCFRIIFYPDSTFYFIWSSIVVVFCFTTAISYPYLMAFGGISYKWDDPLWLNIAVAEFIMFLDMVISFMLAYQEDGELTYVTAYDKIAHRYIFYGSFIKDFITWFPIFYLSPKLEIFVLLKSTRFNQFFEIIETKKIIPLIKSVFDLQKQKILEDEQKRNDILEDHNHIMKKLAMASLYHILYLSTYIIQLAYLIGLMWAILIQQPINKGEDNFIAQFGITFEPQDSTITYREQLTIFVYYAFTTLSTVGLGDYYPVSNFERLFGCVLLLGGVATQSYIMGILAVIIDKFVKLDEEFEDSAKLQLFFSVFYSLNGGKEISLKLKTQISDFLENQWKFDRQNCIQTEYDKYLFEQLPSEVQVQIFTEFLYRDFLVQFRRFFRFNLIKITPIGFNYVNERNIVSFPFYDWDNLDYQNFVVDLLSLLRIRVFNSRELIINELEEINDIHFVQSGLYMVGYPIFKNRIMTKFLEYYDWQIRRPLNRKRKKEIEEMKERLDYMLTVENKKYFKDQEFFNEKRLELFQDSQKLMVQEMQQNKLKVRRIYSKLMEAEKVLITLLQKQDNVFQLAYWVKAEEQEYF